MGTSLSSGDKYFTEHFLNSDVPPSQPNGSEFKDDEESVSSSSSDSSGSADDLGDEEVRPVGTRRIMSLNGKKGEFVFRVEMVQRDDNHEEIDTAVFTGRFYARRKFDKLKISEDPVKYRFQAARVQIFSSHKNLNLDRVGQSWQVFLTDVRKDSSNDESKGSDGKKERPIFPMRLNTAPYGMDTNPKKVGHGKRGPKKEGLGNWMEVFYTAQSPWPCFEFEGIRTSTFGTELTFSYIEPRSRLSEDKDNKVKVLLEERKDQTLELAQNEGVARDMLQLDNKYKAKTQEMCNCTFSF